MDPNDATWITLTARPRSPRAQPTRTQRLLVAVALIGLASVYALAARPDLVAWLLLAATVTTLVAVTLRSARGYRLGRAVMAIGAGLLVLFVVVVGGLLVSGYWEARHPNVWPPEVVGVSPDGRIELVTQDVEVSSFFRERASRVMLRWRGDEAARRASLGCFRPGDLDDVAFTGPGTVELRWLDGQMTVIRFDPGMLAPERTLGECVPAD
jgi:hypothetical protein